MARYARLRELGFDTDDSELFEVREVGIDFLDQFPDGDASGHSSAAERAQHQKILDHMYAVQSTELATEIFSKLQNSKGYGDGHHAQQQQQQHQSLQEKQNIENGNPNVAPDPTTQPNVVAICSHSSTATGASLQEQQQQQQQQQQRQGCGRRGGASPSGRWVGRNIEERSGRWRTVGCDSHSRDNSGSARDAANAISNAASSRQACSHWTPSIQRGIGFREREPASSDQQPQDPFPSRHRRHSHSHTQPQPQERQSCAVHSHCIDDCQCQRMSKEPSPREPQFSNASAPGSETMMPHHPTRSDSSFGDSLAQETGPTFQRSSSTREAPGHRSELSVENWIDHHASKGAHGSNRTKHRVSFSLTENHEMETQKLREKFREPNAPRKKGSQAKEKQATKQQQQQQALRYNYEQPGFVEREKENICAGKAYTIYGVKEVKDCLKGSSGRHHQLVRAFSVRENGSSYAKMPRALSVNDGGRHVMPLECDTCGKGGIGIVFLGPHGDDANFCKSCKASSECGWSCSEGKPPRKKKSIMDYCRKILRLPPKSR